MKNEAQNLPAVAPKRPNLHVVPPRSSNPSEDNPRRRRRRGRRRNPENPDQGTYGTVLAVALGLVAAGGGYLLYKKYGHHLMKKLPPAEGLAGALSPGTTLAASSFVVGDATQPIQLSTNNAALPSGYDYVPELRVATGETTSMPMSNVNFGSDAGGNPSPTMWSGRDASGTPNSGSASPKAIAALVTNVNGDFARDLYERSLAKIAGGADWSDPAQRDAAIKDVLQHAAPKVDWSRGLEPYTVGDPAYTAWAAAELLGAVANQSYWNKKAMKA
jgi:hypothetical protein